MQQNTTDININPQIGIWQEGKWFWASDSSELTIIAPTEGIISFHIAIPKIEIHSHALPITVEIRLNEKSKCSRELRSSGSFRVQCSAQKGEELTFKIICSNYIVPDDLLNNKDNRKLSVILRDFTITERPPLSSNNYRDIKYLVYSSHKTASQSIVASLKV